MCSIQKKHNSLLFYWMQSYTVIVILLTIIRVLECCFFYKQLFAESLSNLVWCFLSGFVSDSMVAATLLVIGFIISLFIRSITFKKNKWLIILNIVFLLSAINFFHIIYFGISFNAYTLLQINVSVLTTAFSNIFTYILLALIIAVNYCFIKYIAKYISNTNNNVYTLKSTLLIFCFWVITSFYYLSFPLYYYFNHSSDGITQSLSYNGVYTFLNSVKAVIINSDDIPETEITDYNNALIKIATQYDNVKQIKNGKLIREITNLNEAKTYKHIIIIIMESMGQNAFNDSIAPNLYLLKNEGVYFSNCKATGPRTQMAVSSILTGIPNINCSNFYRKKGNYKIETIADYLTPLNYNCRYIHNGYLAYDNVDKLLLQGRFNTLIDANIIKKFKQKNEWGNDDETLFNEAYKDIKQTQSQKTLHILQSITNHEPYQLPNDFIKANPKINSWNKKLQTYYYADCMLGKFITQLKQTASYDSTLILITGDHGEAYQTNDFSYNVFHVPLVILSKKTTPMQINEDCSHIDIPYTTLGLAGYKGETIMLGENLFNLKANRIILSCNYQTTLNAKRNDTLYRYSFETRAKSFYTSDSSQHEVKQLSELKNNNLEMISHSYYQVVKNYLLQGKIKR